METVGYQLRTARPRSQFPRARTASKSPSPPSSYGRVDTPPTPRRYLRTQRYVQDSEEYESDSSVVSDSTVSTSFSPVRRPRIDYQGDNPEVSHSRTSTTSLPRLRRSDTMPYYSSMDKLEYRPRTRIEDADTSSPSPPPPVLSGSSRLAQLSRADKGLLRFQESDTLVKSTISRDNTAGEHARHASLFAQYGRKIGPRSLNELDIYTLRQSEGLVSSMLQNGPESIEGVTHRKIAYHRSYGAEDVEYSSYRPPRTKRARKDRSPEGAPPIHYNVQAIRPRDATRWR